VSGKSGIWPVFGRQGMDFGELWVADTEWQLMYGSRNLTVCQYYGLNFISSMARMSRS